MFGSKMRLRRSCEIEDAVLTASEDEASRMEPPLERSHVKSFWFFCVFVLVLLAGRAFFLIVVEREHYARAAQGNSIRSIPVSAPRGRIFDRNAVSLVKNLPSTDIIAAKPDFPTDEAGKKRIASILSGILGVSEADILERIAVLESKDVAQVIIQQGVSQDDALRFSEKERFLDGVFLEQTAKRHYEDSFIFSHIIGYNGVMTAQDVDKYPGYLMTDLIGRDGIERSYEGKLRGVAGAKRVEVDSRGRIKREITSENTIAGSDIILSIDSELQKKLYDSMASELEKNGLKNGAAVAMNPKNGEILALVSMPSYDNNLFSNRIDSKTYADIIGNPDKPMFNRAVLGEYPPASTIKPILSYAALAEGTIDEGTRVESRGGIQVGSYFFGDWKTHGFTDVRRAIAVSSDVFFYAIGGGWGGVEGLGMERMKRYENIFGLGRSTGIDLVGEADGFIPDEAWKQKEMGEKWYIGNSYHASIGQGFLRATPLQLAVAVSAIANGGTVYEPRIVSQIRDSKGNTEMVKPPTRTTPPLSDRYLRVVREGMRMTVTEGTALGLNELPVAVAGKTGTAQYGPKDKTHGWFESFAPFDDPKIVLVVLVEGQGENGYHAVPVAQEVYEWYFSR